MPHAVSFPSPSTDFLRLGAIVATILFLGLAPVRADEAHDKASPAGEGGADETSALFMESGSPLYRVVKYLGKYHVMVIHFPIALLLGAAVAQWFRVARGTGDSVVAAMLWPGALGAVAAVALGWMYAYDSVYFGEDADLLFWHRWLGTGTATVTVIVLALRRKLTPKPLAAALTLCAVLVGITAHYGASLVHGSDFLLKF